MKIGFCIKYNELGKYSMVCETAGFAPPHVQINRLPAEPSKLETLKADVQRLRAINPDVGVSLHAYKYNLSEPVGSVLGVWLALAEETLGVAGSLGADFVNFHLGYGMGGGRTRHSAYRDSLVAVLRALLDAAKSAGAGVHIENLYPRPLRSECFMVGDRASDFDSFFAAIPDPRLKLCYDYGHGNIDEYGIEILRRHAARLGSVHAHDNDQQSDLHLPVLSRQGSIDWRGEFEFLENAGFHGPFLLEGSLENQLESLRNIKKAGLLR